MPGPFTDADREQLRERGLTVEAATEQIERLRAPERFVDLVRPCTPGDGIRVLADAEVEELGAIGAQAAREGRALKLVPASGAATRMFQSLLAYAGERTAPSRAELDAEVAAGKADAMALDTFLRSIRRFAFAEELRAVLASRGKDLDRLVAEGPFDAVLDAVLSDDDMGYARLPKGLLKFHAYPDGARTPFEEHLVEAANVVKRADGACRVHLTVSPDHVEGFAALLESVRARYETPLAARFEVGFSTQKPSTDTLSVDSGGRPFRLADGTLLFRPAGHGALLDNLAELDAEWVWIKNIDNVVPDRLKEATYRFGRALIGLGVRLQRDAFARIERLESRADDEHALDDTVRVEMIRLLDRPIRVCGMVRNVGEPGGGPFWARAADGSVSCQIVEMAEVDPRSAQQREIVAGATHFNPVFMVCGLRDRNGTPYDLRRFVDPERAIVTRKSFDGRELRALELPGLWNGSMARWNTVFVEVPLVVFNPVKTVNVLLEGAHQPA
jgi:hypothetical protein